MKEFKNGDVVYVDKACISALLWKDLGLDKAEQVQCRFVGWSVKEPLQIAVVERGPHVFRVHAEALRTRARVTVKLWRAADGAYFTTFSDTEHVPFTWSLVGEHTFEVEDENAAR